MANGQGTSKTTTDHNAIKKWAEERGGKPAKVKGTGGGGDVGMIRFMFGGNDQALEEISWNDFFKEFDNKKLALLYQDKTREGQLSRFFKFVRAR
ncbi:hypothetical protein M1403_04025 [Patescibacteria group bacterium]|nr:hypothetical protein [Patescibacteria group bacterium]